MSNGWPEWLNSGTVVVRRTLGAQAKSRTPGSVGRRRSGVWEAVAFGAPHVERALAVWHNSWATRGDQAVTGNVSGRSASARVELTTFLMSYGREIGHPHCGGGGSTSHSWRARHQTDSSLEVGDAGNGWPTSSWTAGVSLGTSVPRSEARARSRGSAERELDARELYGLSMLVAYVDCSDWREASSSGTSVELARPTWLEVAAGPAPSP